MFHQIGNLFQLHDANSILVGNEGKANKRCDALLLSNQQATVRVILSKLAGPISRRFFGVHRCFTRTRKQVAVVSIVINTF